MAEEISDSESVVAIGEEELALLIKMSIQTLKRKKKKCGRKEVFNKPKRVETTQNQLKLPKKISK